MRSPFGLAAPLLLALGFCASTLLAQTPPNVLLVITDDQGFGDFSLHGNTVLSTPNLDRFAREGIRFDRFYVSPVCAPTRASLLTGRWHSRTGVWGVTQRREVMRAEEVTLAETLRAAGYRTGIFGKWHNGEQYPLTPPGQGFDEFLGFAAGHWNNYFDAELTRGSQPEKTKGYITDVLTDAAIAFMEQNRGRPFFCYVPYNAPHSPFQTPEKYFARFKGKGLSDELASVYAMCEHLDDSFGRLLAALDRLRLRENTIVLFLTDNGPSGVRFNAGMRGSKASVHEGGTRVPLFVQYPARFRTPKIVPQIAAHIDVYPTLLELCGARPPASDPKIDGVSLVPLIEGRVDNWPDRLLFTHQAVAAAKPQSRPGAVRSQRYRAVLENKPETGWQLYDMLADPEQKHDLAQAQPDVVRKLSDAYDAWWRDVSKAGFGLAPIPVGHREHDPVRLFAPQASLHGKVRFFQPQGYANTWLTGWSEASDRISFPLSVAEGGEFEVALIYGCTRENAGATVRVASNGHAIEAVVPAAPAPRIPLPHRGEGKDNYIDREWSRLVVGKLRLARGADTLTLDAVRKPGAEVMDLKQVELRRVK